MGLLQWHDISYAIIFYYFPVHNMCFSNEIISIFKKIRRTAMKHSIIETLISLKHIVDTTKKSRPHIREWKHLDC